jgi:hypothetical protein
VFGEAKLTRIGIDAALEGRDSIDRDPLTHQFIFDFSGGLDIEK